MFDAIVDVNKSNKSKEEMVADVVKIIKTLRELVPPAVASNEALARKLLIKKFEIVEINVIMPLHIWMQNNGYCPHFKHSEKPGDKPDSS